MSCTAAKRTSQVNDVFIRILGQITMIDEKILKDSLLNIFRPVIVIFNISWVMHTDQQSVNNKNKKSLKVLVELITQGCMNLYTEQTSGAFEWNIFGKTF